MAQHFDLIVIGSGPAGLRAAVQELLGSDEKSRLPERAKPAVLAAAIAPHPRFAGGSEMFREDGFGAAEESGIEPSLNLGLYGIGKD